MKSDAKKWSRFSKRETKVAHQKKRGFRVGAKNKKYPKVRHQHTAVNTGCWQIILPNAGRSRCIRGQATERLPRLCLGYPQTNKGTLL